MMTLDLFAAPPAPRAMPAAPAASLADVGERSRPDPRDWNAPAPDVLALDVPQGRWADATAALEKVLRKAARYGVDGVAVEWSGDWQVRSVWISETGYRREIIKSWRTVYITGPAPVFGAYEFLSHLEHTPEGTLIDTRPGAGDLPPEFQTADPKRCDHCGVRHARRHSYICRNTETGAVEQFGRQCLRDAIGIDSPAAVAARFRFLRELRAMADDEAGGWYGGGGYCEPTIRILALAACAIRRDGWASKSAAGEFGRSTAGTVEWAMGPRPRAVQGHDDAGRAWDNFHAARRESDDILAGECLDWVRATSETSDYMHNLRTVCAADELRDPNRVGLLVSAVAAYQRHLGRQIEREREASQTAASQHVGELKQRLRDVPATLIMARHIETDWGGSTLAKFLGDDGNVYTWFASAEVGLDVGERCLITGTVKRHGDYNGTPETQLTRCIIKDLES